MIFTGRNATYPTPPATLDRGFWDRPDFGGHVMEASFVDAEPMECDQ